LNISSSALVIRDCRHITNTKLENKVNLISYFVNGILSKTWSQLHDFLVFKQCNFLHKGTMIMTP